MGSHLEFRRKTPPAAPLTGGSRALRCSQLQTLLESAQEAARISDVKYRIIAENTYDWEFWVSPQGNFLYSSPSCQRITGCAPHDFESDPEHFLRLIHEHDQQRVRDLWFSQHPTLRFEFRLHGADGEERWLSHISQPVFDNGQYAGRRGSHRDVTDRRRMEEERAQLAEAVEQAAQSVMIVNPEGRIVYVNPAFERLTGYSQAQAVGNETRLLNCAKNSPDLQRVLHDTLRDGRTWSGELWRASAQGRSYIVEATVSPVKDEEGVVRNSIWMERDVTEEKLLESRLVMSQKMEAIGTLAGGVAHDFNNLLSGILGYASLLKMGAAPDCEVFQAADVIEKAARQAAELTKQLLGFARRGKHQHVPISIHESIRNVAELLRRTISKSIEMKLELQAGRDHVVGDPAQIQQIILNLAINARDAMEGLGAGQLLFATEIVRITLEDTDPGQSSLIPGEYLRMRISDNGCGMSAETKARIFEPFYTTKDPGKGTGMGLAMVYGIVKNHGGTIYADSEVGQGTTFRVQLPLSGQAAPQAGPGKGNPAAGTGRILLVDDEEVVRLAARTALERLGYQVTVACNGREAVDHFRGNFRSIDLVILDMVMPHMGGADCFRELRAIHPNVRAILSTGYSLNDEAQAILDEGMLAFIPKPYDLEELADIVHKAVYLRAR